MLDLSMEGIKLEKVLARQMRDIGFEKATAQDIGKGVEFLFVGAGIFFNPLGKLATAAKVGKLAGMAKNTNRATKTTRTIEGLDLAGTGVASTVSRPRITKPLKEMSNAELVQAIANRAEYEIGGIGAVPGTHKHKYAEKLLEKFQKMVEKRGLKLEERWVNGKKWQPKNPLKGSVKLDVYDKSANIVYDYKFVQRPRTGLKQKQVDRIQHQLGNTTQVIEVNPTLMKRKGN